jgi:hypothetical protein
VKTATQIDADLIAMPTAGHHGILDAMRGSTNRARIASCSVPGSCNASPLIAAELDKMNQKITDYIAAGCDPENRPRIDFWHWRLARGRPSARAKCRRPMKTGFATSKFQ